MSGKPLRKFWNLQLGIFSLKNHSPSPRDFFLWAKCLFCPIYTSHSLAVLRGITWMKVSAWWDGHLVENHVISLGFQSFFAIFLCPWMTFYINPGETEQMLSLEGRCSYSRSILKIILQSSHPHGNFYKPLAAQIAFIVQLYKLNWSQAMAISSLLQEVHVWKCYIFNKRKTWR